MSQNMRYKDAFVILAETLDGWRSPKSEEGAKMLQMHYLWANEILEKGHTILAGPLDKEQFPNPEFLIKGHLTGLIVIKANSKEEAEQIAFQDPFHVNQYRKNKVYSFAIGFANPEISRFL
jgi:uncharacterized protein YciI